MNKYYQGYMHSSAWYARRKKFIATTNGKCYCGSTKNLHVHHATYARFGKERNSDLRLLCKVCHEKIHKYHKGSGLPLDIATDTFIKKIK